MKFPKRGNAQIWLLYVIGMCLSMLIYAAAGPMFKELFDSARDILGPTSTFLEVITLYESFIIFFVILVTIEGMIWAYVQSQRDQATGGIM